MPESMTVEQLGETLSNPTMQAGIAGVVTAFADAVLDTHVGPLARYVDPRDNIRAQDTLGDLVRRDDPGFDQRLRQRTRGALAVAGQGARDGAAISNELGKTVARLRGLLNATAAVLDQQPDD